MHLSISGFRPKFTVRRLMIAVAIAGIVLAGLHALDMRNRVFKYRARAQDAARMEVVCRWINAIDPGIRARKAMMNPKEPLFSDPDYNRRMAAWHSEMKVKYSQAARYPWLPVVTDPPKPKPK